MMTVKRLSPKQMKIANKAPPRNKITRADFVKLGSKKKNGGRKKA